MRPIATDVAWSMSPSAGHSSNERLNQSRRDAVWGVYWRGAMNTRPMY